MIWLLIVFAVEQLRGVVEADEFFSEEFAYEVVDRLGSYKNAIEIYDYCTLGEDIYIVGGGVRLGVDKGGMDALLIKYNDGIEWYKVFGGGRDDKFLGVECLDNLYVTGNTYSTDFLGRSPNFLTGFYLELDYEGNEISNYVFDYQLDIYPTAIWYDDELMIAGYLDNFNNKDVFTYDGELMIYEYSGQERVYSYHEGEGLYGSTSSKELGAENMNPMVFHLDGTVSVHRSNEVGEMKIDTGYIGTSFLEYSSGFNVGGDWDNTLFSVNGYSVKVVESELTISRSIEVNPTFEGGETLYYTDDFGKYEYSMLDDFGVTVYGNWKTLYLYENNIEKEQYYTEFTLLFSGVGYLNGEEVTTPQVLQAGEYKFSQAGREYEFEVINNETDYYFYEFEQERVDSEVKNSINKKLILIPLIIIGNLLYKKYQ